jgi:hypothetical protein
VNFRESLYHETYTDYFSGQRVTFDADSELTLPPWGYRVFMK